MLPSFERQGGIEAWIVDDTGFAKKGVHSVGVARQYCGRLGKTDNCQIAVSLSVANHAMSLPVAYQLYVPEVWAEDAVRREKVRIPNDIAFQTKPEIALDQIRAACEAGITLGTVLADAAYGIGAAFRAELTRLGLRYSVGVQSNLRVWPADGLGEPATVKVRAQDLPASAYGEITWREGSNAPLASRFAALRVASTPAKPEDGEVAAQEWLLIEWPEGESEPAKYWLSTLPADIRLTDLVDITKMRWRIERDYEELKSELGLAHYEGRSWRGFHHHATLCIAAYGFLIRERAAFPPSGSAIGKKPCLSNGPARRGSPGPARKTRRELHRHHPEIPHHRPGQIPPPLPMLPIHDSQTAGGHTCMTQ